MTRKEKMFVLRMLYFVLYLMFYDSRISVDDSRKISFLLSDVREHLDNEAKSGV